MKHVTIIDIATLLKISKSTVSRALAGDKNISEETRSKILTLANDLGYQRNEMAANLRSNHSKIIGIIVPEMITPFFLYIIISLQKVLNEHGFKVIIYGDHL